MPIQEVRYQSDYPYYRHDRRSDNRLPKSTKELNVIIAHQVKMAFQNRKESKKREVNTFKKNRQVKLLDSKDSDADENHSNKSDDKEVSFASDSEQSNNHRVFDSSSDKDSA